MPKEKRRLTEEFKIEAKRALLNRGERTVEDLANSFRVEANQLYRRRQLANDRPTYSEAKAALTELHGELESRIQPAAASLAEGLEKTLTLHRLGVYGVLGRSFKTTNCLESANALVEERCAKVDSWEKLEPAAALARNRAARDRTEVAAGQGPSATPAVG